MILISTFFTIDLAKKNSVFAQFCGSVICCNSYISRSNEFCAPYLKYLINYIAARACADTLWLLRLFSDNQHFLPFWIDIEGLSLNGVEGVISLEFWRQSVRCLVKPNFGFPYIRLSFLIGIASNVPCPRASDSLSKCMNVVKNGYFRSALV